MVNILIESIEIFITLYSLYIIYRKGFFRKSSKQGKLYYFILIGE